MSGKRYRLLNVKDIIDGVDTTILLERLKFPDSERIVYPRETENVVFHQIGGTYKTLEDFNHEWEDKPDQVEKTVLCPNCREPITYFTPKLDELVNFTCMDILDARRLTNALIELLRETPDNVLEVD